MKAPSAEFVRSAFDRAHWLDDGRPEVAFLGRSNVGKSSLINSLLMRKGLARTSNTPGRTQSVNFFLINAKNPVATRTPRGDAPAGTPHAPGSDKTGFYFTDLPGYGYAKVSKTMRADWGKMAEQYLSEREVLALCIQLVDARHEPSPLDRQLNQWLVHYEKPHIVVATKADKISRNELQKSLKVIKQTFAGSEVLAYSARSGAGRDELWSRIFEAVAKG